MPTPLTPARHRRRGRDAGAARPAGAPPAADARRRADGGVSPDAAARKPKPHSGRGSSRVIVSCCSLVGAASATSRSAARTRACPPAALRVRVLSPKPTAVYRWFSGRGTVTDHEARTLAFDSSGTLAELLPPGTAFAAGDILGRLRGAQPIETLLARHRARLAFYQQMRDSMRAANNQAELRQAEIQLAEKQRLVDEATAQPRASWSCARASRARWSRRWPRSARSFARARRSCGSRGACCMARSSSTPRRSRARASSTSAASRWSASARAPRTRAAPAAAGTAADVGSPDAQAAPRFVDCTLETSGGSARKQVARRAARRPGPGAGAAAAPGAPALRRRLPGPGRRGQRRRRPPAVWIADAGGTAERRDVVVADAERRRAGQRRPARRRRGDRRRARRPARRARPITVER